jgi:hypothetical protein
MHHATYFMQAGYGERSIKKHENEIEGDTEIGRLKEKYEDSTGTICKKIPTHHTCRQLMNPLHTACQRSAPSGGRPWATMSMDDKANEEVVIDVRRGNDSCRRSTTHEFEIEINLQPQSVTSN